MYIYDNIILNYFEKEKSFRQNLWTESRYIFYVQKHFSKNRAFLSKVKPDRPETAIKYGACALHTG